MSVEDVRQSMEELKTQRDKVEAVRKTLESNLTTIAYENEHTIKQWVFDKVSTFPDMDEPRRKMLYNEIFSSFTIDGDKITVKFFYGMELVFNYQEIKAGDFESIDTFSSIIPLMYTF